jgi:hypothetical protein
MGFYQHLAVFSVNMQHYGFRDDEFRVFVGIMVLQICVTAEYLAAGGTAKFRQNRRDGSDGFR